MEMWRPETKHKAVVLLAALMDLALQANIPE